MARSSFALVGMAACLSLSLNLHAQSAAMGAAAAAVGSADSGASSLLAGKAASKLSSSSSGGLGPVTLPDDFSKLRAAEGDLVSVDVYDTPEYSGEYRVDPAGDIALPLIGKQHVEGLTQAEISSKLESALRDGQVLVRPQVNVDIAQYASRYVIVQGEVGNPGRVPVIGPVKLSSVLAQAGGLTALAGSDIKIRHAGDPVTAEKTVFYSKLISTEGTDQTEIEPGDTITVPRAGIIYVLGAVYKPGGYIMQEDGSLNVAQALAMAGGTILQARTGGLRVVRRNPDGTVSDIPLSYDKIAKGEQQPIQLQQQDIVYVPVSKIKAGFTATAGLIASATSATIVTH